MGKGHTLSVGTVRHIIPNFSQYLFVSTLLVHPPVQRIGESNFTCDGVFLTTNE